jgi:fructose-1,6-bisphosphatase
MSQADANGLVRDPITMTRFLLAERQREAPDSTGSFAMLLQSIQLACKAIANATCKAGIGKLCIAIATTFDEDKTNAARR